MQTVIVNIDYTGNNFCAYAPILSGCVSTASSLTDMKKNIREAIEFHIEGSQSDGDIIPEVFGEEYELEYILSTEALLNAYSDVFE